MFLTEETGNVLVENWFDSCVPLLDYVSNGLYDYQMDIEHNIVLYTYHST